MSERITHDLIQGTPLWHQFRLDHFGASEAAAMLGLSPYMSRTELLKQKATGIIEEVSDVKQRLFDAGHAAEEGARQMAEFVLNDELYPATYSFGKLSASVDGITIDGRIAWEHKLVNADLAAAIGRNELPEQYQPQCQQIMLVTGAEEVLFMASNGTPNDCHSMTVKADPAWFKRIQEGWGMFEADLLDYKPVEVIPAAKAAATIALPALSIQVAGSITLHDNLKLFGEKLTDFIAGLPEKPSTDQEFADSEAAIKTLETAEKALEAAKANALAQVATVDEMSRTVALYAGQARQTRLALTALVKARKEFIRVEIVQAGKEAFTTHLAMLNKRIGRSYMIGAVSMPDFAGAIKGKKTVSSLRDAVDTMLASGKIEANSIADKAEINIKSANSLAKDYTFLFRDMDALLHMDSEAFDAIVINRVRAHQDAEKERLEAEREKIRAEEAAKAKVEAERVERERLREEGAEAARVRNEADLIEREKRNREAEAEAARIAQERAQAEAEAKVRAEAQAKEDARLRAEREAQEQAAGTETMIGILRKRIERSKPHAGIAKAIDAYLAKEKKAA